MAELGVSQLTVFQRTPCWSPPRLDYQYPAPVKTLFAWLPIANTLHRYFIFWRHEARFKMVFELDGIIAKVSRQVIVTLIPSSPTLQLFSPLAHWMFRRHIKKVVKNPGTASKLTPTYGMGCKRITPSGTICGNFKQI